MQDRKINHLRWTSPPLAKDLEVAGYPLLSLWVSSSWRDASLFVYLEVVDTITGFGFYVTEGMFRACQRKEVERGDPEEEEEVDIRDLPGEMSFMRRASGHLELFVAVACHDGGEDHGLG